MKWNESYSSQAEGKIHHIIKPCAKEILSLKKHNIITLSCSIQITLENGQCF